MSENKSGNPDLETMRAMGLVIDGGGFLDVRSISMCTPSKGCQELAVMPIGVVEDPMGESVEYTVFQPSRQDLNNLRAEMGL